MLTAVVKVWTLACSAGMQYTLPSTSHKETCPRGGTAGKPRREHIIQSCKITNTSFEFPPQLNFVYRAHAICGSFEDLSFLSVMSRLVKSYRRLHPDEGGTTLL